MTRVLHTCSRGRECRDVRRRRAEAGPRQTRLHAKRDGGARREAALAMSMMTGLCVWHRACASLCSRRVIPRIAVVAKVRGGASIDGDKRRFAHCSGGRTGRRVAHLCLQNILDRIRRRFGRLTATGESIAWVTLRIAIPLNRTRQVRWDQKRHGRPLNEQGMRFRAHKSRRGGARRGGRLMRSDICQKSR